jgi:hypothetical protein
MTCLTKAIKQATQELKPELKPEVFIIIYNITKIHTTSIIIINKHTGEEQSTSAKRWLHQTCISRMRTGLHSRPP